MKYAIKSNGMVLAEYDTPEEAYEAAIFAYEELGIFHEVVQGEKQFAECDWCGEPAEELSHPHRFDMAIGKKMCWGCWDHDREVYKGSYGEDIGEFKPIKTEGEQ